MDLGILPLSPKLAAVLCPSESWIYTCFEALVLFKFSSETQMIIADKAQHKISHFPTKRVSSRIKREVNDDDDDDFPNILGSQSVLTKILTIAIDGIVTLAKHSKIR